MLSATFNLSAQQMLWGITAEGGASGAGAIFKTDANGNNMEVPRSITTISGRTPQYTKLVEGLDGILYGMTVQGGGFLKGVLFSYDPVANNYSVLFNFDGTSGAHPYGSLIKGSNGKLYGMTSQGGDNDRGVIFEFDPVSRIFVKKHDFDGLEGGNPYGDMALAEDGLLSGVTHEGGAGNFGV
jgi:uncharacterized repeat protein (TIGR03803 family)